MAVVQVRYYGGAAAAAGTATESVTATDLTQLLRAIAAGHAGRLDRVLAVASVLVDGVVARDSTQALHDGQKVDILPPFAGG